MLLRVNGAPMLGWHWPDSGVPPPARSNPSYIQTRPGDKSFELGRAQQLRTSHTRKGPGQLHQFRGHGRLAAYKMSNSRRALGDVARQARGDRHSLAPSKGVGQPPNHSPFATHFPPTLATLTHGVRPINSQLATLCTRWVYSTYSHSRSQELPKMADEPNQTRSAPREPPPDPRAEVSPRIVERNQDCEVKKVVEPRIIHNQRDGEPDRGNRNEGGRNG